MSSKPMIEISLGMLNPAALNSCIGPSVIMSFATTTPAPVAGSKAEKLNSAPISSVTFFIDGGSDAAKGNAYSVREVIDGKEGKTSERFTLPANEPSRQYFSIPPHSSFYIGDGMATPPRPRIRYTRK